MLLDDDRPPGLQIREALYSGSSFSGYERNAFFLNAQAGTGVAGYLEAGFPAGLDFDHDGRAVAPLDVDGDGDGSRSGSGQASPASG